MLRNEYMYSWVVQLLHEAGSKDFIVTSIAAFSALCLVVGLGQGLAFLYNPYVQLWRDLHSSFMPPLGCVTITGLFQRNSADLQQVCCPSLLISYWFGSHGSFVTYKFKWFQEKLRYPTSSRDVGSEPVTAPLDKVPHMCCKCSAQGTTLGTGTLIWVSEGTSAPAAPESLLV